MDRDRKRRRLVELGKDLLIVLLACSAVWLTVSSQMVPPLQGGLTPAGPQADPGQVDGTAGVEAVRPLRMTASLSNGTDLVRYGVQYDAQSCSALFQQTANLLAEALSSAGEPEPVTRRAWEQALLTPPGVCFDFQGEIPLPVLVGWLSGEDTALTASVRRVALTVWQDSVALYFRDERNGSYYRCLSEVANEFYLADALSSLPDNGTRYAFESDLYEELDPDTLLSSQLPTPVVYAAANPVSGGQSDLERLMEELGLSPNPNSYYYAGNAHVGRSGNDTLRLLDNGTVVYESEEGSDHFQIPASGDEPTLFETVEACRRLTAGLTARCGQGRLFLSSAAQGPEGLEVVFEYSLNGSQVRLDGGSAAYFLVRDGQVVHFSLRLRSYEESGETSVVMPYPQAVAAMAAEGLEGEELQLIYVDGGGERVSAAWAAADR